MEKIDTHLKAYVLGYIATDIGLRPGSSLSVQHDSKSYLILEIMRDVVQPDAEIQSLPGFDLIEFVITKPETLQHIWSHLSVEWCPDDEEDIPKMMLPQFEDKSLTWSFILGVFDYTGFICKYSKVHPPACSLEGSDEDHCVGLDMLRQIAIFAGIPHSLDENTVTLRYNHVNCMDFLGNMYRHVRDVSEHYMTNEYMKYVRWYTMTPGVLDIPRCEVYRDDKNAIVPGKARPSDAGYDLSIIKEYKRLTNNVVLYDTGIKLRVPYGMYVEVVPRSSLSKSGYMLANSIGIIDASYTGNIYVALAKIDPEAADIELPFRCCQLIFRKQVNVDIVERTQPLDATQRNEGGFGSTNPNT